MKKVFLLVLIFNMIIMSNVCIFADNSDLIDDGNNESDNDICDKSDLTEEDLSILALSEMTPSNQVPTSVPILGADASTYIRVKVSKSRTRSEQLRLKTNSSFVLYDDRYGSNYVIASIQDTRFDVLMDAYYNSSYSIQDMALADTTVGPIHIWVKDFKYDNFNEAYNKAVELSKKYKEEFYPFYEDDFYYVYAGMYISNAEAEKFASILASDGMSYYIDDGSGRYVVIYNSSDYIELMYKGNSAINITSSNGYITMNNVLYRGNMGFYVDRASLISVNKLCMKYYLYGVVPNEIFSVWPEECLKAQTIAARTYAYACAKDRHAYSYDVSDNQNSQVYKGYHSEKESTNKAVDDTDGIMIYYSGDLITAYFHSTSGGCTEDSENIWIRELPYIRGVKDVFSNISSTTSWKKTLSKSELIQILNSKGYPCNEVLEMNILEISDNNRVLKLRIKTDRDEIILIKEGIRKIFGYKILLSSWFDIGTINDVSYISEDGSVDRMNLESASFISDEGISKNTEIKNIIGKDESIIHNLEYIDEYYFYGRGFGHGLGMSQYGAKEMAKLGFNYEEILKHYYTGVEVK